MFDYRIYARIKERDLSMWKDCSINGFKNICKWIHGRFHILASS